MVKVVVVHNYYQQAGGEDRVLAAEVALLKAHGHDVVLYTVNNDNLTSLWQKVSVAFATFFSWRHYRRFQQFLRQHQPAIVHVHNYFPQLSPAIFYAAKRMQIPVVHTLHNYRAICPSATLFDGKAVNLTSIRQGPFWAVPYRLYRQSWIGTWVLAGAIALHQRLGTWRRCVDRYIALSPSQRDLYIQAGWPADAVMLKGHFVAEATATIESESRLFASAESECLALEPAVSVNAGSVSNGSMTTGSVLYVGRLSAEKGIEFLLQSWLHANIKTPLTVLGTGPLQERCQQLAAQCYAVTLCGAKLRAEVLQSMRQASLLVVPSLCLETFGLVVLEAFAQRLPVLVAGHGGLADLVRPEQLGWHFTAGDAADLATKVEQILAPSFASERQRCVEQAYAFVTEQCSAESNYQQLMAIYQQAITAQAMRAQSQDAT